MSEEELARLREEVHAAGEEAASSRPRCGRSSGGAGGSTRAGRCGARWRRRRAVPLVHKQRRIEKPRLVVLCDVSDSVRHVSRFMLQFAYTLQELFSQGALVRVRGDLGECTELFKQHEIQRAVDLAYAGGVVNVYANSNFGRAFKMFEERFLDAVTPKTTVLVIGDARNNYNPPEAWALADDQGAARGASCG